MKKVYYLTHCGSGRSVHGELLTLHKQIGNKLLFHIEGYDYNKCKPRIVTLKAYIKKKLNYYKEETEYIDFHSSLDDYKFCNIKVIEIEDNEEPKKSIYYEI